MSYITDMGFLSPVAGASIYTFGHPFKKGDLPQGKVAVFNGQDTQCDIPTRYDDGSARFAVITTMVNTDGSYLPGGLASEDPPASQPALTEADLTAALAGKGLVVQVGALGTVNLAALVGTAAKTRTRIAGSMMSEFHYHVPLDGVTAVIMMARVYSNGAVWVRYTIHNGYMSGTGANRVYNLTVTRNGSASTINGIDQKHNTRVTFSTWLTADPQITPVHGAFYMRESKAVPNYKLATPSQQASDAFVKSYTPMGRANLRSTFSATGYDDQIGLLPRWDAVHVMHPTVNSFKSVIANAESGGSYSIHYMDATTKKPWAFSSQPKWWQQEVGATGGEAWSHDTAHQPSIGYLAYVLTGDYFFVEEVQYWATYNMGMMSYIYRLDGQGILTGIARAQAWGLRTLAHAACITPDDDNLQTEFANSFRSNMQFRKDLYITGARTEARNGPNVLGAIGLYAGGVDGDAYSPGDYKWVDAPWMQHFNVSAMGYSYDLEVPQQSTSDRAMHFDVCQFVYQHPVGMLGDASGRPYPYAAAYGVEYGYTATPNELDSVTQYYPSWYEQWQHQKTRDGLSDPPATLGSPLLGSSGGDPSGMATGYWGNLFPAIAYAVSHGAPGADAAWERLTSASNFEAGTEGFADIPQFGIYPRQAQEEPVLEIIHTYTVASGGEIYAGRVKPTVPVPAWVPPAGYFADIPMVNSIADVAGSTVYSASELNTNFSHWTGSAILKNHGGPLGSQTFKGAGHEASSGQANIQSVVTMNFNNLMWEVSNTPNQRNANTTFDSFTGLSSNDGTPYNGHTYLGLQSWPADWGTGGSDHFLMNIFCAGSGYNNKIYAIDISMARNGYNELVTTQPQNGVPEKISFRANGAASGGSYPITVQDNKRKGWWLATNGDIQWNLFLDSATMVVTQVPPLIGNGQSACLCLADSLDLLVAIDGGYSSGSYAGTSYKTLTIRDLNTGITTNVTANGEVPTASDGYDGPDKNFKTPDTCGFHWVEELGAIFGIDANGDPAGPRLAKLTPPATNPTTTPWTWSYIPLQHWPADAGGSAVLRMSENALWSKFRWVPSLQAFTYATSVNVKPQVIKVS